MQAFFHEGGRLIDSSPMYGSSQAVIGYGLAKLGRPPTLFSADKVWISSGSRGPEQIEESRALWGVRRFDLLQVHNLLAWEDHLSTLFAMKAEGRVRYVGITTSEGRRHGELEKIMESRPIVAPDPTALGTLGLLLAAEQPPPWWTMAVPLLWCLISGATLWAMKSPEAWILAVAGVFVVAASRLRRTAAGN